MVEHNVANVVVAGSIPVARSFYFLPMQKPEDILFPFKVKSKYSQKHLVTVEIILFQNTDALYEKH
jgi:hypothetical protein